MFVWCLGLLVLWLLFCCCFDVIVVLLIIALWFRCFIGIAEYLFNVGLMLGVFVV